MSNANNVVIKSVHKTRAAAEKRARKIWSSYVIHHPETARTKEQFLVAVEQVSS